VKYTPLSAKERFTALQSGEVDVLSRNTTWTLVRDTALGLNFAGVNYYDGQGFMVRKDMGIKSAKDLGGASVCVNIGTTTELNMADFFRSNSLDYKPVVFEKADEVVAAYDSGRCDVYTTDQSGLAAQRQKLKEPDAHMVLPEVISKEPLGPVVRHGDDRWLDVVKWALYAMLEAEEYGVNSGNVDSLKGSSKNPVIKRLLGVEGDLGKNLGLDAEWAYRVIKQVGNYGESFDRYVGPKTPLQLPRGVNKLWKDGGLMYPMPVR
jgi:general L-amino acid transport system substrate-binding protein